MKIQKSLGYQKSIQSTTSFSKPLYFKSFSDNQIKYIAMKTNEERGRFFDEDYYENGSKTGKSNYTGYKRLPKFTKSRCKALIKK